MVTVAVLFGSITFPSDPEAMLKPYIIVSSPSVALSFLTSTLTTAVDCPSTKVIDL